MSRRDRSDRPVSGDKATASGGPASLAGGPAILAGGSARSILELDERADAIAARVLGWSVRPGDRVGLRVQASFDGVAALHGLLRAGVSPVLVHPRLTGPEVATLLEAAGSRLLVTTGVADGGPGGLPDGVERLELGSIPPAVLDVPARGRRHPDARAAAGPAPRGGPGRAWLGRIRSGPELVVPTSGTTARPKLARLPLDRIAASVDAWNAVLPAATGWLLSLGLAHVAGIAIVARATAAGVPLVIPDGSDPDAMLEAIETARSHGVVVSHLSLVATQLQRMLAARVDGPPPDGIAAVLLGGGPIPEDLVVRAVAAGWPILPSYGMTETASGIAALRPDEAALRPWSAGRTLPGSELRIVDPDVPAAGDGRDAAEGSVGEIVVRGPTVFAGYLGDAEATATTLEPGGWLRTGDLGSLDADGYLRVVDRRDDLIVSGGENVAPAEVEAALASHPGLLDVGVAGAPDPAWGRVPVAYVVVQEDAPPTDDELWAHARRRLAPFKVPARFVRVAELPRAPSGKLLRRRLVQPAARPAEEQAETQAAPVPRLVPADDGQPIAIRRFDGSGERDELGNAAGARGVDGRRPTVVLLHATLSSSGQLLRLARRLAEAHDVVLVDRRGSGASRMADPRPVPVGRHVADVVGVLDDLALGRVVLVGHSFGGVVALETAARRPARVAAVLAWEPPYLSLAGPATLAAMSALPDRVAMAYATDGPEGAARAFLGIVVGPNAWDHLHPRQRASVAREGAGAVADVTMEGLDPDGLARIVAPVVLATGSESESFYAPIADALAARIATATRIDLEGLRHPAPITDPTRIATLVDGLLERAARPMEPTP